MVWDVSRYLGFGEQRLRPAIDLIARIPLLKAGAILDLGCGPGTVTGLLRERWPEARVTGVDSSTAMLAKARELLPAARFIQADIATMAAPEPTDLVFSNAALHWLPDHPQLFRRLRDWVRPGGVLAVQMPENFAAPSHRLIREIAGHPDFAPALVGARMGAVAPAADYYRILCRLGAKTEVWSSEYLHVMGGDQPVLDWLRGTTLLPYLGALGDRAADFLAELGPALIRAYPPDADGVTLFPFRRLFMIARF